jgi:cyclopropane fatty-acyl-phospholipid synthase-like methyltransferase
VIELAAGPAAHGIELARRGFDVTALDLSPAMVRHAARRAREAGVPLTAATGDMSDFALGRRFALILTMAGAVGHLGDERALQAHFRCVARHLAAGGAYIVETSPPGDEGTRDRWRLSRHGREFDVRFSPRLLTIRVRHPDGRAQTFSDALGLRLWTAGELAKAAARAGLAVVQRHRRLAGQSRMVLVFGRQSSSTDWSS